jgi:hypothetical protein
MAGLYNYIYRRLVDANVQRDAAMAEEALRLLEYQRETWVMLLDRLRQERPAPPVARVPPAAAATSHDETYGSLSLQG